MEHRNRFSASEECKIKDLLQQKIESGNEQRFRVELRKMGFYISDYARLQGGFAPADFDDFVAAPKIIITD